MAEKYLNEIREYLKKAKLPEQVIEEFISGIKPFVEDLLSRDVTDKALDLIKKSGKPYAELSNGTYAFIAIAPPADDKSQLIKQTKNGRWKVTMLVTIDKKPIKLHVFTDSEDVASELAESKEPVLLIGKYMIRDLKGNKVHVLDLQTWKKLS